jgi:phage virion morphogenesis protein
VTAVPVIRAPELERLASKLAHVLDEAPTQKTMRLVGADLTRSTKRRISSEKRAPDGTPWRAWSDAYKARKKPGSMLNQSHALLRSVQSIVGSDVIEHGSNDIKAGVHNFGHTITSGPFRGVHIPQRQFLGLSDADESLISSRMIEDVRVRLGAA